VPQDVKVIGCQFHDNRWSGMYFAVARGVVANNTFDANQEAHIFCATLPPNILTQDVTISGNNFFNITKHHISSHAIEIGGKRIAIVGNTIRYCDHGGIALTDSQNISVVGNVIGNFDRLQAGNSGIDIITTETAPNQPKYIDIRSNRFYDDQPTVTGYAAVSIGNAGSAVTDVVIEGNNCGDVAWRVGKAINIQSGKWGARCIRRGNNGTNDVWPYKAEFNAPGSTGTFSRTGVGFRPQRLEFTAITPSASAMPPCTTPSACGLNSTWRAALSRFFDPPSSTPRAATPPPAPTSSSLRTGSSKLTRHTTPMASPLPAWTTALAWCACATKARPPCTRSSASAPPSPRPTPC
jgi:parallel beta-helix repeat protein